MLWCSHTGSNKSNPTTTEDWTIMSVNECVIYHKQWIMHSFTKTTGAMLVQWLALEEFLETSENYLLSLLQGWLILSIPVDSVTTGLFWHYWLILSLMVYSVSTGSFCHYWFILSLLVHPVTTGSFCHYYQTTLMTGECTNCYAITTALWWTHTLITSRQWYWFNPQQMPHYCSQTV